MRKQLLGALLAAVVALPVSLPTASVAQDFRWQGNRNSGWDPSQHYRSRPNYRGRRMGRNDRVYRGADGRFYCRRSDGTTGLVVGALAGGLLGNAIGGDTLGTLLGAGGGALLGRSIGRQNVSCR